MTPEPAAAPCPICAGTASWPIAHRQDAQIEAWRADLGETRALQWRLCRICGNGFPAEAPDLRLLQRIWTEARVVETADAADATAIWARRRSAARAGAARSLGLFAPLVPRPRGARFLDIACGLGETVRRFADAGWDAAGIDADPTMLPLHEKLGIRSRIGQLETLALDGRYGIIHIAHAIYFITEPMRFLERVPAHLDGDGVLAIVLADFLAASDPGLPGYAHSFYPNAASMRHALARAGFTTILSRRHSGSIYLAARHAKAVPRPVAVRPILWRHRTKALRYAVLGRPYLALRQAAKRLLKRR